MQERRSGFAFMALVVMLTATVSYYAGASDLFPQVSRYIPGAGSTGHAATSPFDVERMEQVRTAIDKQFVNEIDLDKLMDGALKGMVESTGDKYSHYYNPEEYASFLQHFEPSFSGIGVHVEQSPKTGLVTVVAPIAGTPAERAGLRAGDAIIAVDGKDITDMSMEEAVKLIKGPKGTKVSIKVQREGTDAFELSITRATIQVQTLEYKMIDAQAGVGYVWLKEFNKQSGARLGKALEELQAQGMKRLVFDLRLNPGGLLDESVDVASYFVGPDQPVVHVVERGGGKETHKSKAKPALNVPVVVLINGGSASASEIVAGAIQDLDKGVLMGEKSFGKGSVQSFFGFPDGAGIKLTTAKYLTAKERSIDGVGLEPDKPVEQPKLEDTRATMPGGASDKQLEEAIRLIKSMQ